MKKLFSRQTATITFTLILLVFAGSATQAFAQTGDEAAQADTAQGNQDANWVTALGLTPDQVSRIRSIRQQNKMEWQAARQRLNQAQHTLDEAIYSDDASEAVIEQRAREVAEAQAAEVSVRARTELGIRHVLTPEQLNTFRTIRQQRIREAQIKRRMENDNPQRPLRNRRLQNGINLSSPRDRSEGRPGGGVQGGRNPDPLLSPSQRRGGFPRRIRP
ncbi:MAG: periplasmic protein CpxP/Spy [Acidimicrobiaceae bacterium]|jgi:Spy/CpxP family protein refolding chaperone|nr:periplasmic protein CpxP/Spy [Acidimicrobiaceae bacterium]